ncbi:hypothetical protein DACRYDRAFT_21983 [Dacryopinax primogenitus]|uniref:Uncharacterized protein n=1 Tax=Dacryopinax primogenitus (strain DJM 731) TaxID=1858805 RepID=M5GDD3_DACPD|nr:uncharacterized protein DACRYDRAFT_21983 [Dacryopinax primogenitus]EJU02283.1 hypothetical protein DACRYDRAFT_21983 [Dacryopinax primogenitus]
MAPEHNQQLTWWSHRISLKLVWDARIPRYFSQMVFYASKSNCYANKRSRIKLAPLKEAVRWRYPNKSTVSDYNSNRRST